MKCFITLVFACTTYLANAQSIVPPDNGMTTFKSIEPVSHFRIFRRQKARTISGNYSRVVYRAFAPADGPTFDAVQHIEMNRFAGYILHYERTVGATMVDGRKEFRNYAVGRHARFSNKAFSATVNAVLQVNH